jgi:hypothetical protein
VDRGSRIAVGFSGFSGFSGFYRFGVLRVRGSAGSGLYGFWCGSVFYSFSKVPTLARTRNPEPEPRTRRTPNRENPENLENPTNLDRG